MESNPVFLSDHNVNIIDLTHHSTMYMYINEEVNKFSVKTVRISHPFKMALTIGNSANDLFEGGYMYVSFLRSHKLL